MHEISGPQWSIMTMILCQLEQTAVPKENLNNSSLCTYLNTWLKNLNLKCTRQAKGSAFHIFINNANAGCVKSVQAIKHTPHKKQKCTHTFTTPSLHTDTPYWNVIPLHFASPWSEIFLLWSGLWSGFHFTWLLFASPTKCLLLYLFVSCMFYPVQSQSLQRVFLTHAISSFACACLIYEKPEQLAYFYNKEIVACTSGITSFFINTGSI